MSLVTIIAATPTLAAMASSRMVGTGMSRMEAADHWIVYSEVREGKVFKDEKTATHHRKVASYY